MAAHECSESRRLQTIESVLDGIRCCVNRIKRELAGLTEWKRSVERQLEAHEHAREELGMKLERLAETVEERDREQDRRINKLSLQVAGLIALVEVLMRLFWG